MSSVHTPATPAVSTGCPTGTATRARTVDVGIRRGQHQGRYIDHPRLGEGAGDFLPGSAVNADSMKPRVQAFPQVMQAARKNFCRELSRTLGAGFCVEARSHLGAAQE